MRVSRPSNAPSCARRRRHENGKVRTYWRSPFCGGSTPSIRFAAVAFIRRPVQDGQNPRPLQLNATSRLRLFPQLDPEGRVRPLGAREPVRHGDVRALFEDRDGTLWLGTWLGLYEWSGGALRRGLVAGGQPGPSAPPIAPRHVCSPPPGGSGMCTGE